MQLYYLLAIVICTIITAARVIWAVSRRCRQISSVRTKKRQQQPFVFAAKFGIKRARGEGEEHDQDAPPGKRGCFYWYHFYHSLHLIPMPYRRLVRPRSVEV